VRDVVLTVSGEATESKRPSARMAALGDAAIVVPLDAGERPVLRTPPSMEEVTQGRLCTTLSR
jgi:hypothetical protein